MGKDILEDKDMEAFEKAAEARLDDWEVLNAKNRKVGTIHMGGIYIECLLKAMICCKYTVSDGRRGKWRIDGFTDEVSRPSHDLTSLQYTNLLKDIYDDMPENVMKSLEYISEPDGHGYIEYRYMQENLVSNQKLQTWMTHFIEIYNYLQDKLIEL